MEEEPTCVAATIHVGTTAVFYIYSWLLTILNNISVPVLFADDTSVTITDTNITHFQENIKTVFEPSNKWFFAKLLQLNFNKINFIHFKTKNICNLDI